MTVARDNCGGKLALVALCRVAAKLARPLAEPRSRGHSIKRPPAAECSRNYLGCFRQPQK